MYRVLARLDLGRDAASIYSGAHARPWTQALLAAYRQDPQAIQLQWLGLAHETTDALIQAVETMRESPLRTAILASTQDELATITPQTCLTPSFLPRLDTLRHTLYAEPPPPLTLLHVAALGRHGRAATIQGERRVAVDLNQPEDHALMQILHEECHAVTDREVAHPSIPRETRFGTAGYAVHRALEDAAVAYGAVVLAEVAPDLLAAYEQWRCRMG
ncbi:MAG: hypothetical protein IV100_34985 [Myxococcales bacterium]|nr:hypothetical protein [Myxococcales bacterium]